MTKEQIQIQQGAPLSEQEQETMVTKVWNQFLKELGEEGENATYTIHLTKFDSMLFGWVVVFLDKKVLTFVIQYNEVSFDFKRVSNVNANNISNGLKAVLGTK